MKLAMYYVEREGESITWPRGAWIVRDHGGRYIRDFRGKGAADRYCDKLNISIGVKPVIAENRD